MATLCTVIFLNVWAFGLALRGVEKSKTPAYFGWKCRVFNTIQSAIQTRGRWPYRSAGSRAMNCDQITLEGLLMPWMTFCDVQEVLKVNISQNDNAGGGNRALDLLHHRLTP